MTRTPQQTFLSDQALAAARERTKIPGTMAVVIDYATDGQQCSWCPCSAEQILGDRDGHQCAGCPREAAYVMHHFRHGSGVRNDIPLCHGCKGDAIHFMATVVGGAR